MSNAQLVSVVRAQFDRTADQRGTDMSYTIEFVRMGIAAVNPGANIPEPNPNDGRGGNKGGKGARSLKVDAKHNSLRKIAAWKLGNADKWRTLYNKNKTYFNKHRIIMSKVPDYRLPLGTKVYY